MIKISFYCELYYSSEYPNALNSKTKTSKTAFNNSSPNCNGGQQQSPVVAHLKRLMSMRLPGGRRLHEFDAWDAGTNRSESDGTRATSEVYNINLSVSSV